MVTINAFRSSAATGEGGSRQGGSSSSSSSKGSDSSNSSSSSQHPKSRSTSSSISRWRDELPHITRTADLLVAAVGHAELVRKEWVKPGATIIDVGINVLPSADADVAGDVPQNDAIVGKSRQGLQHGFEQRGGLQQQQQPEQHELWQRKQQLLLQGQHNIETQDQGKFKCTTSTEGTSINGPVSGYAVIQGSSAGVLPGNWGIGL